jgi:hypothetical protein
MWRTTGWAILLYTSVDSIIASVISVCCLLTSLVLVAVVQGHFLCLMEELTVLDIDHSFH